MATRRPNEGNPRVRIDEGIGASALPRRGHLFGGGGRFRHGAAFLSVAFAAALPALAETWTFNGSGTSDANYATANAWKNERNANVTFDESTTSPRTYVVPAGKTLVTPNTTGVSWRFTANEGDVFTLQGSSSAQASLLSRVSTLTVPLLVLGDNAKFKFDRHSSASTRNQELLGSVRVDASVEHPASIVFEGFWDTQFTNATTVTGSGALVYAQNPQGGNRGYLRLNRCDASAFTGPVTLTIGKGGADTTRTPTIYISSADNIGGNPPEFLEKGLALSGVNFNIGGNITLPANRGLYSLKPETEGEITSPEKMNDGNWAGPNRIDVASSYTFTVQTPIGFEDDAQEYPLTKWGGGTMRVPGWASGGWLNLGSGTLDITGASVSEGEVTPAAIGKLTINGSKTVKLTLSGDGSSLADGRYVLLTASARLPDNFDTLVQVVNSSAFTLPSGKKAMYSVVNGTDFVVDVKDDVPTWTFTSSNTGNSNYAVANAWTDENGTTQTLVSGDTTTRDYIIPGGKTLKTPNDSSVNWSFTSGDGDTFILKGTPSSEAKMESRVVDLNVGYLRMLDHSNLSLSEKDWASVRGTISVEASEAYPAIFFLRNWQSRHQTNETTMVGSGALVYTHPASTYNENILFLKGDASGFTGPLGMKGIGITEINGTPSMNQSNEMRRLSFAFTTSANIAGNPATFLEKGLVLGGVRLLAQGDASLGVNRGLYVSTNFTNGSIAPGSEICVKSGCTFAIPGGVSFEDSDYPLILTSKNTPSVGGGTLSVSGWATNGTIKVTTGTLEITGASVANGVVTPATIGSLEMTGGAVKLTVTGDGSPITPAMGASFDLIECGGTLPSDWDSRLTVVNDGAFTFAPGTKASYSVEDGKIKMSVVEYVPEWTLNTNNGVYTNANVWTDEAGVRQTWTAAAAATKMEYFVPVNWTLKTPGGSGAEDVDEISKLFVFSSNPDSVLTVRSGGLFQSNVMYVHVPNIVLNDSAGVLLWIANNQSGKYRSARSITGTLHVNASESNPAFFRVMAYYGDLVRTNAMTIVGFGGFKYTRQNGSADGIVWATGDNSGFTGPVSVWDMDGKTNKAMFLHVTSSENIGGNPETYKEKGLELHSAQLCVHGNVALAPNRGFYVSSNSVVNVDSGKSFTSPNAVGFTEGTTLDKTGAGAMNVTGWANGTIAVNAGTLNISGATFASGAAGTPVSIGGIECAGGATVKLTVTGDGAALPFANATNVLVDAESALPVGFAEKVQVVNDNAFTVPAGLKTKLVVIDGAKLALETTKRKGTLLIVR